jgi:glutathione synthase/RimK-type ligase-like ATP-grasp enzyme
VRIALATSQKWPQLHPDDHQLLTELGKLGAEAVPAVWTDASTAWTTFDLVVIRSCWDYHVRLDEFLFWLEKLDSADVPVANPSTVLRWNSHKGYLAELEKRGVAIPATRIVRRGSAVPALLDGNVIIKPAVSASANETHLFASAAEAMADLERLVQSGDVIIQEFVPEVISDGEWSLVYVGGELSHAVKKAPKAGDFRVQQELGGSATAARPPAQVREAAERALAAVEDDLLYARVDLVQRPGGVVLMELELIEPSLFLETGEGSSSRFAEAIEAWVRTRRGRRSRA